MIFNPDQDSQTIHLGEGTWKVAVETAQTSQVVSGEITVPGITAVFLELVS